MRAPALLALAALTACGGKNKDGTAQDTGSPASTLTVTCTEKGTELRFECIVETPEVEAVTLTWGPIDDPTERTAASGPGRVHSFPVWGLRPQVLHEVTATTASASGSTGITPPALPASWQASWSVTGTTTSDAVLVPLGCADAPTMMLLDGLGRPMAYQRLEGNWLNAIEWTDDLHWIGMVNQSVIVELDLLGQLHMRVEPGPDSFEPPLHHEVHRGDSGITWVLGAREYFDGPDAYVMDVVYGLDASGQRVAEWEAFPEIAQPLDTTVTNLYSYWANAFPGAIDYTHANALFEKDGELLVSFRRLDSVYALQSNPGATNFGEVLWRLSAPDSDEPSDFAITSTGGVTPLLDFDGQHTATFTPDGLLGLYDNRRTAGPETRAVFFELDRTAGTADIVETYDLGRTCANQGSAFGRADGSKLITCPEISTAYEFAQGATDPSWTLSAQCLAPMFRAIPVDLPETSPFGGIVIE